jgi:hypothetical protein
MRRVRGRSDGELIAATPGDPEAFAEFYRRYERSVIGFFMHWCRSAEVAADLMAETFAAAFESAARYQPELGEPSAGCSGSRGTCWRGASVAGGLRTRRAAASG